MTLSILLKKIAEKKRHILQQSSNTFQNSSNVFSLCSSWELSLADSFVACVYETEIDATWENI